MTLNRRALLGCAAGVAAIASVRPVPVQGARGISPALAALVAEWKRYAATEASYNPIIRDLYGRRRADIGDYPGGKPVLIQTQTASLHDLPEGGVSFHYLPSAASYSALAEWERRYDDFRDAMAAHPLTPELERIEAEQRTIWIKGDETRNDILRFAPQTPADLLVMLDVFYGTEACSLGAFVPEDGPVPNDPEAEFLRALPTYVRKLFEDKERFADRATDVARYRE